VLTCGHVCCGIKGEKICLPCLNPICIKDKNKQQGSDWCRICYVEQLKREPCIQLESCGHIFHYLCVENKIKSGWVGQAINFAFLNCALCKRKIHHWSLSNILEKYSLLEKRNQKKIDGFEYIGK